MKRNIFIYITSFICGMSIMAVELSASRLLAPYFGSSQIIWTVVIGLIMISLSIGNVFGGRIADKHNNKDKLYAMIWIAAVWIAVIPFIGKYIIVGSVFLLMWILPNNLLVSGSILSSLIIFSLPLVILGMVSPFLVKLGVKDMKTAGKTSGQIYAFSTIGSIIGTFIPTFLTIPTIGTSKTFFAFALVLNLLCLYHFISARKNKAKTIVKNLVTSLILLAIIIAPMTNSYAFWQSNILEEESLYNYLRVTEEANSVILSTNVAFGVQSIYKKDNTLSGYFYEYALMAPFFIKNTDFNKKLDVLVLGFGTGTFSKQCKNNFPNSLNDGVEIDQKIVDLSKKFFDFKDEEANVFVNDGRTFLMSKDARLYDTILVDAFHDITIPFHMSTKEFFLEAKKHLKPNGTIVMNINMRPEKNTKIMDYLTQTLKSTMKKVYVFNIEGLSNSVVISSDDANCRQNFSENIKNIDSTHPLFIISRYVDERITEITDSKYILTDEVAPVEILGQKVLDELISNEISYIKQDIKSSKKSVWDILEMF